MKKVSGIVVFCDYSALITLSHAALCDAHNKLRAVIISALEIVISRVGRLKAHKAAVFGHLIFLSLFKGQTAAEIIGQRAFVGNSLKAIEIKRRLNVLLVVVDPFKTKRVYFRQIGI